MKTTFGTGTLLAAGALVVLSGCAKTKRINHYPDLEVPEHVESTGIDTDTGASDELEQPVEPKFVANELDPATDTLTEQSDGGQKPVGTKMDELSEVYFDLDTDELTPQAAKRLESHAAFLKANPKYHVVVRGHTDSSGTDEYNLSLGSRRAQVVRERLAELGVAPARLETVSYGENFLLEEETDESARSKNRRVEFFVYTLE